MQDVDQPNAFDRWTKRLADALDVHLADQILDRLRAGRRRANALFAHRVGGIPVLHEFSGVLHQRQQPTLGDSRRRFCLLLQQLVRFGRRHRDTLDFVLALDERRQRAVTVRHGRLAHDLAPTRRLQRARTRTERLAVDLGRPVHPRPDGRRIERGEEPAGDEIEQFRVVTGQRLFGQRAGRHDREVVGHLRVVEDLVIVQSTVRHEVPRKRTEVGVGREVRQDLVDGLLVVLGQRTRVGTRVRENLVRLVTTLRRIQRAPREPPETPVALALQAGQIEKWRR